MNLIYHRLIFQILFSFYNNMHSFLFIWFTALLNNSFTDNCTRLFFMADCQRLIYFGLRCFFKKILFSVSLFTNSTINNNDNSKMFSSRESNWCCSTKCIAQRSESTISASKQNKLAYSSWSWNTSSLSL